jgi:hypothetical protein
MYLENWRKSTKAPQNVCKPGTPKRGARFRSVPLGAPTSSRLLAGFKSVSYPARWAGPPWVRALAPPVDLIPGSYTPSPAPPPRTRVGAAAPAGGRRQASRRLDSVRTPPCGWLGPARGEFLAPNSPLGPPPKRGGVYPPPLVGEGNLSSPSSATWPPQAEAHK